MSINKQSLQARIKNLSKEKEVSSNIILQSYFFDAVLKRIARSKYSNKFVFKGGFLLSTVLGIDMRSTMDIDFLLRNEPLVEENIIKMIHEIIEIDVDDNITFEFVSIEPIRQLDEYGGFNVVILGHLENIKVSASIDIATGDPITPNVTSCSYKCLISGEELTFPAYNFETIISEKLETVLKKGTSNSR